MEFTPSVYEHAAKLIGRTPWETSRDADLLFRAHAEAFRLYNHRPVVVGIDIYNLEAEAYGARVEQPDGNGIPAITKPFCATVEELIRLDPFDPARDGRIPMVLTTGKRLAHALPGADVRIPVSGPFSIASNLAGFDALLASTLTAPAVAREALCHLAAGQVAFCREIVRQGLDIAFFESAAAPPLVSPPLFRSVELPALRIILQEAAGIAGHAVPCIIGGDTTPILDSILETGTGYVICPAETDQRAFMARMAARPDVTVRVNLTPEVLTSNDRNAVYGALDRILELIGGRENSCIGTGALPFETDPDVVVKARDYVALKTRDG